MLPYSFTKWEGGTVKLDSKQTSDFLCQPVNFNNIKLKKRIYSSTDVVALTIEAEQWNDGMVLSR